jgi:NADH:ubiquinone oxidoreductase subunit 2 (subunit N)
MNTGDTMMLYIAIELQSFSLYLLSTLKNNSVNSAQAGLRYFLIGSLASTLILLGIALLYYATGLTNFESIYLYLNITDFYSSGGFEGGLSTNSPYVESMDFWNFASFNPFYIVIIFSFVLIITGIFIKLGAAPFHQWAPDVYALVPTPVTAWLIIIPKISLFVLLFNILEMIIGTGNAESYGGFADFIYQLLDNNNILKSFNSNPEVLEQIELNYFSWNLGHITNLYGEATAFYPHFLQIELINSYGTPIINENIYSRYEDVINSIWNNYYTPRHNLLAYILNITPLGSITIRNFLIFISIISLIIGAIGGLYQIKIKRLLAFSAISQLGFLIIAISINNKIGLDSFVFYLFQYSLTNVNIFLILIAFATLVFSFPLKILDVFKTTNKEGVYNISEELPDIEYINQLKGWLKINPILALSFIISIFSLIGVPPLPGFFAKQQVLSSALSLGFIFLSILAILMSVLSAYYYLNLINNTIVKDTYFKHFSFTSFLVNIKEHKLNYFNKSTDSTIQPINLLLKGFNLPVVWSYIISLLTLSLLLFMLKSNVIFNFVSICTFCFFCL